MEQLDSSTLTDTCGLKKAEFAAIVGVNPDNCTVTIRCTGDGFWFITLQVLSSAVERKLLTERGGLKSWRDPAAAVLLLQELCPQCQFVQIDIHGWTFVRRID